MPLAVYIKAPPQRSKQPQRLFYGFVLTLGLASIIFSVLPLASWYFTTLPKFEAKIEKFPVPQSQILSKGQVLGTEVQVAKDPDGFSYFTTNYKPQGPRPKEFSVTIPKLKVTNAKVKVDSLDFKTSLAHFPGSGLPGEIGNSFVTGHSVLPLFNDPKNYRAIFTKLSDLSVGDDVFVKMDGQTFHYVVQYAKVVSPHDLSVLLPISQNGRNLTLMTCVPPGTSIKRLVVITSLI